jgi:hypothetical protein
MSNGIATTASDGQILAANNQGGVGDVLTPSGVPGMLIIKRAADGTALGSKASVVADSAAVLALSDVVRNGAGDYTVTLAAGGPTAAKIGAQLTCNTTLLNGSAVVTDATTIAVKTRTDAGVATDSIFTLTLTDLT